MKGVGGLLVGLAILGREGADDPERREAFSHQSANQGLFVNQSANQGLLVNQYANQGLLVNS